MRLAPTALLLLLLTARLASADDFDVPKATATAKSLELYSYATEAIGAADGRFAPIIKTADGGFLMIGTSSDIPKGQPYKIGKSRPTVMKLDKAGAITWQKDYKAAKGFLDYEGGSLAPTSDGNFVIYVLSYVHPAIGSVGRFLKIDPTGKILWELKLRGDGKANTPFPDEASIEKDDTIELIGHIYKDAKSEQAFTWIGTIDKTGKLVADKVGGKFNAQRPVNN